MNGHRFRRLGAVAVLALMLPFGLPASPLAAAEVPDQVLVWNQHAYNELIGVKAQAPPVALLHFAMVHGAIYDAVNAIDGGYQPYLGAPDAQPSDSKNAAAAAAAYQVLLGLIPDRAAQLEAYYQASIEAISEEEEAGDVAGGVEVGNAAAATMLAARDGDGRFGDPLFSEGFEAGEWRRLTPTGNNFKWVGDVKPFLIPSAAQFATAGPQELTSAKYAAEFDQVKALGRATGSTRTPDQTQQALFWADHTAAMWTRIARQLSTSQDLSTTANARYFAMLYLTTSDAVISCFQDKERWGFWRPQTAIREAATDPNPSTVADPTWTSFIGNPPYPDHPSGANCFASSFAETLQDFFGTNRMSFSATHATLGITRSYTTFSEAIGEVRLARVYAGIHFMTADAQAVSLGRKVADWRQAHYFQQTA
jgi:PAP2 superfamily